MSEPRMHGDLPRRDNPVQFREEDHHLEFVGWTKTSDRNIPWWKCKDCGATFSEAYPTVMAPSTDCPALKASA